MNEKVMKKELMKLRLKINDYVPVVVKEFIEEDRWTPISFSSLLKNFLLLAEIPYNEYNKIKIKEHNFYWNNFYGREKEGVYKVMCETTNSMQSFVENNLTRLNLELYEKFPGEVVGKYAYQYIHYRKGLKDFIKKKMPEKFESNKLVAKLQTSASKHILKTLDVFVQEGFLSTGLNYKSITYIKR